MAIWAAYFESNGKRVAKLLPGAVGRGHDAWARRGPPLPTTALSAARRGLPVRCSGNRGRRRA